MKAVKVTERNIMFSKPMGKDYDLNLGLILGINRNYIIDTGVGSGSIEPILDYIGSDKKPIVIINTHWHWDHMWGNWVFKDNIIISHSICKTLADKHWNKCAEFHAKHIDGEVQKKLPNLLFDDKLYFPDDGISIFHSPGHTEDCISIYDEFDRVLHAGDNIGDTDEIIVPEIDTDLDTFKRLLVLYGNIDFEVCISGHNKPQGKDVVSRMESALHKCRDKQINQ